MNKRRSVEVDVPPGVDTGVSLRIMGEGHAGEANAPPGNLYVELRVARDPFFKRDGSDVHTEVPITLSQAVLGATVNIPSLRGEVELQVPPGTQPGTQLVMRGRGIPNVTRGGSGHQYVHLKVVVPTPDELSETQRELVQEFRASEGEDFGVTARKQGGVDEAMERVRAALRQKDQEQN